MRMRRFIIFTEGLLGEGENKLTSALRETGAAWAHYFPSSWMVVDAAFDRNTQWWTEIVMAALPPNTKFLIVEVAPHAWFARCPPTLAEWIRLAWLPGAPTE
jgi:hypothetical protein